MKTCTTYFVAAANGARIMRTDSYGIATAKAAAIEGSVITISAPSMRQLRKKAMGREGLLSRPLRRAAVRQSAAMAQFMAMKEGAATKPGAQHHW